MAKKKRMKEYIKQHPEIFEVNENIAASFISDEDIPDIRWFYQQNQTILEEAGGKKPAKSKKRWYLSKKVLIPVSAVLVLAVFFSATPIGRAMAETIYRTVMQCFNGEVSIKHGSGDINMQTETANKLTYYTVEEVRSIYHVKVAFSEAETLQKIEVEAMDYSTILFSTYTTKEKHTISIMQMAAENDAEWSSTIILNEGRPVKEKLSDGTEAIGFVGDDSAYAIAYKDNTSMKFSSDDASFEEFTRFIRSIEIK